MWYVTDVTHWGHGGMAQFFLVSNRRLGKAKLCCFF